MNKLYSLLGMLLLLSGAVSAQLDNLTGVTLTFTPGAGAPVVVTASDDGNGLSADGPITLMESSDYTLTVAVQSGMDDITDQVTAGADEHRVFLQQTGSVFSGDIRTLDTDNQGLPVGLSNDLTTECTEDDDVSGMLRVVLADLGDQKTAMSTIDGGTALFDVSWILVVEDDTDAPPCENEEELITDVVLAWIPVGNTADTIFARAQDPDGEGPLNLEIQDDIELMESTEYTLMISPANSIEGEDITEEIMEEDDEHLFFFSFDDETFTSPAGDGNIDSRADPINYNDTDENGLPVGLSTNWLTECGEEATTTGSFRIILKHQPDIKSTTSTVDDGGTDVDLTFVINVNEDPNAPPARTRRRSLPT